MGRAAAGGTPSSWAGVLAEHGLSNGRKALTGGMAKATRGKKNLSIKQSPRANLAINLHFQNPVHFPDAADSTSFDVQLGDIILTATDGLFDNMPDYMILQELKKLKNSNYESIQRTARSIAEQAHELAYDPNYMSPFAQFACDNGLNVRGGKPDDITVLLSIVAEYTD